ncbi:unnamed protein product [Microthlaspi erraticum]|uniref:Arabidopsis retrotransposon Orf1 C-terminal domain-containing protein n=1 Tax=Microthlaspi erraticum TaxID=1685480 RepID=A0A6D2JDU2_9BRAS|nr:unnamed protein product [Microthlaspi erraticum]
MESYKELTCEFLASMRYHQFDALDRAELDQGWGWITFLAKGERKMVTFRQLEILFGFTYGEGNLWNIKEDELQRVWATIVEEGYSSSRSKAAQIRSPVLRYVHKALANTFFARKATGTINEGEVKLLDMGIKPIISRTRDGKKIRGDRAHAGNLMPLLEQLLSYKVTAYNTRWMDGHQVLQDNLLIEHKELDGRYQFKFTHPLAGPSKLLLPNPELTTVVRGENIDFRPPVYTLVGHEDELREEEPELDRAEDRAEVRAEDQVQENEDLGEPECYYFEEYEAPRMNPSVVAAYKRIGLLQKFNKWQGKAIEKMQKSMDKMVSKIKSLEKKVSGSSSKKKKATMAPTFPGVDLSSPLQGGFLPKSLTEPHHLSQGKEKTTRREGGRVPRLDALTRPHDSISPNRGNSTRSS